MDFDTTDFEMPALDAPVKTMKTKLRPRKRRAEVSQDVMAKRREYIAALRSGKYRKCRFNYRHAGRYCALGVAYHHFLGGLTVYRSYMDDMVAEALHFTPLTRAQITQVNDYAKWSFEKIADCIERQIDQAHLTFED